MLKRYSTQTQPKQTQRLNSLVNSASVVLILFGFLSVNYPAALALKNTMDIAEQPLQPTQTVQIEGRDWTLVSWQEENQAIALILNGKLSAHVSEQNISGFGGCNSYNAEYRRIESEQVQVGHILSTKMACLNPNLMSQENTYFKALQPATKMMLNPQGQLMIQYKRSSSSGDVLLFECKSVAMNFNLTYFSYHQSKTEV